MNCLVIADLHLDYFLGQRMDPFSNLPPAAFDGILGTFMYRTFFGFQLQLGDPHMGSAIASAMFAIILVGVSLYLFGIQSRMYVSPNCFCSMNRYPTSMLLCA
jgi:hypothetical protein